MTSAGSGRTSRLELTDATLREWDAFVVAAEPEGIVLDRSAFYPGGGGQPPDHGVLVWRGVQTRIVGVRRGDDLLLLPAEGDPIPSPGTAGRGAVEDDRRTALMRTHSALHIAQVRIVDIVGLDVQADGGTHVASTRAIGRIEVVKVEKKGKANRRLRIRLP